MPEDPIQRIAVEVGDITDPPADWHVDTIVNAANESLLGGGGVDGAIHAAAGPALLEHNRMLGGCKTGLAVPTPAFDLEARGIQHILHTVGPVWSAVEEPFPGEAHEAEKLGYTLEDTLLASCYVKCLELAATHQAKVVAFPAISTGVYHFPKPRAARIAFGHVLGHLARHETPARVIFCCFSEADAEIYRQTIASRDQWMYNRGRV